MLLITQEISYIIMNHIIKGIIIVIAITSMLIVGTTSMITIMQTSFASQGNTTATTASLSSATGTYLQVVLNNPNSISSAFTVTVTGNNPQPYSFSLSSISPQFVKLDPGSFAVSIDTDYPHSYSKDCTGTISAGQNLSCTIHITAMQTSFASQGNTTATTSTSTSSSATGTYLQVVLNNPNSISSAFTVTVTGNNPQPYSFSLSSISPQFVKLDPGS